MRILTGVDSGWRTIEVVDADPGQRAALVELGFGPDLVWRYPPGTRYFDRAVANLSQGLDEMVRQGITKTAPGWLVRSATCSTAPGRHAFRLPWSAASRWRSGGSMSVPAILT